MGQSDVRLPLFVFGTLLDRDLLAQVLARDISDLRFTPGTADGFRRLRARGESFPVLVHGCAEEVDGLLIDGLSATDFARLCFFEAGYALASIAIATGNGPVSAQFFAHDDRLTASDDGWALETWRAFDKPLELTAAARWMAGFQDNHPATAAPLPEAA